MSRNKTIQICRFEKYDSKRVDAIKNKKLWFSAPDKFNDLFDCNFHTEIDQSVSFDRSALMKAANDLYETARDSKESPISSSVPLLLAERQLKYPAGENIFEKFIDAAFQIGGSWTSMYIEESIRNTIRKTTGVCCFFGVDPLSQLMWAHYADNHQGFCTVYNYSAAAKKSEFDFHGVNYTSEWPLRINAAEIVFAPDATLARIVSTKGIDWAHEKEFRFVRNSLFDRNSENAGKEVVNRGGLYDLPPGLQVDKIIVGVNAADSNAEILKETANSLGAEFEKLRDKSFIV